MATAISRGNWTQTERELLARGLAKGWNKVDYQEMEALYRATVGTLNDTPFGESFKGLHERGYRWNSDNKRWVKPRSYDQVMVAEAATRLTPLPVPVGFSPATPLPTGPTRSTAVGRAGESATEHIARGPGFEFLEKEANLTVLVRLKPPRVGTVSVDVRPDFISRDLTTGKLVVFESKATGNLSKTFNSGDFTDGQAIFYDAIRDGRVAGVTTADSDLNAVFRGLAGVDGQGVVFGDVRTWFVS